MKKLTGLFLLLFIGLTVSTQAQTYLLMEMMDVDQDNTSAYLEVEKFWSGIHQQRVEAGDILGWDLWTFLPAGTNQGYRYMTVTLYDDPVKMFRGLTDEAMESAISKAYPDMGAEELTEMFNKTGPSRDIAVQIFAVETNSAGDFSVGLGTYATMAWMKTDNSDYEKMEAEIFKPMHESSIEAGDMMGWSLINFMLPYGSNPYASHVAMNFFEDLEQCVNYTTGGQDATMAEQIAMEQGLATRDMKSVSMGTVIMSVR